MGRLIWCLVFVAFVGTSAVAKMIDPFRSGGWRGGAFIDNRTGKLKSCIVTGRYKSGILLSIGVMRSRAIIMGFSKKGWRYRPGVFSVRGRIDNNKWTTLRVKTLSSREGFSLLLNKKTKRILRTGRVLRIRDGKDLFSFNLTRTAALMDRLESCVNRRLRVEAGLPVVGSGNGNTATRGTSEEVRTARLPQTRDKAAGTGGATPPTARRGKLSIGSGFFVSRDGHIATNRHVVSGCRSIRVGYPNGQYRNATLVAAARRDDLAILKTALASRAVASFRAGSRPRLGDDVVIFGFPYFGVLAKSGNLATGNISALAGLANATSYYQVSAPMQPGNSGGPVIGASGNVIAIAQSKLNAIKIAKVTGDIPQNINFAIKGSVILEFLEANDVKYLTRVPGQPLKVSEIAASAKEFTVIVRCSG